MERNETTQNYELDRSRPRLNDIFRLRQGNEITVEEESRVHALKRGIICGTESRGHATPGGQSPTKIVLDASQGFIPLWAKNTTLRWRFQERSISSYENPVALKEEIRNLFGEAILAWGSAAPVRFSEDEDLWDFEIVMKKSDECDSHGCVLASAFFPDSGRHKLELYPNLFRQSRKEQVDTLIHESGHIFGLRHFFAQISETKWPSEIFGVHNSFSIMNYNGLSELTDDDRNDLIRLYQSAWSGALTQINGTPIRLVKPYSAFGSSLAVRSVSELDQTPIQAQVTICLCDKT